MTGGEEREMKVEEFARSLGGEKDEKGVWRRGEKVFLVVHGNTIEVRTDEKLGKLLREKYESVMLSRYFGKGGVEVVLAGQLSEEEVLDLVRLGWELSI